MAVDPKNTGDELGELGFEFFEEGDVDSDKKFNSSIKNLLVLIKDFYGADSAAVYWFNKAKQGFKLLAVSDDGRVGSYKERFTLGNDCVSTVCLRKKSEIFNIEADKDKSLIEYHSGDSPAKSIIVNPLLLEDETIAVVLCESKTLNFFGTPNIYTLQVFSESITNYIKYFSLNEDFEFEGRLLGVLASGKLENKEDIFSVIKSVFERYVVFDHLYIAVKFNNEFRIVKAYSAKENEELYNGVVESESVALNSAESRKIEVRNIGVEEKSVFMFSGSEKKKSDLWFCCLPVIFDEECEALAAFDEKSNLHMNQKILSKVYKQMLPFYLLLKMRLMAESNDGIFPGKDYFLMGLDSGISKCRLFNENNLYCVYFGIDKPDSFSDDFAGDDKIEEILADFLMEKVPGQNMVYKLDTNKYAIIADVSSDEKVFLEIEKIRKSLSGKIYNIEGKDISFTASFAIKRLDDLGMSRDDFLGELDNLFELARSEGGDIVKI